KARTKLAGVEPNAITRLAGVQLDDLLNILSISRFVYDALLAGEDERALKTAAVIQRWYRRAGAEDAMTDYAAQQKVNWDIWLRNARHSYSPIDLVFLLQRIDVVFDDWQKKGADFNVMYDLIGQLSEERPVKQFQGLDEEILFGAMNAV